MISREFERGSQPSLNEISLTFASILKYDWCDAFIFLGGPTPPTRGIAEGNLYFLGRFPLSGRKNPFHRLDRGGGGGGHHRGQDRRGLASSLRGRHAGDRLSARARRAPVQPAAREHQDGRGREGLGAALRRRLGRDGVADRRLVPRDLHRLARSVPSPFELCHHARLSHGHLGTEFLEPDAGAHADHRRCHSALTRADGGRDGLLAHPRRRHPAAPLEHQIDLGAAAAHALRCADLGA